MGPDTTGPAEFWKRMQGEFDIPTIREKPIKKKHTAWRLPTEQQLQDELQMQCRLQWIFKVMIGSYR